MLVSPDHNPAYLNADSVLASRLSKLAARWRSGELDDAVYASAYFLVWQMAVHGRRFASRRSKAALKPDPEAWMGALEGRGGEALRTTLLGWCDGYHFLGVIPNVPAALVGWLRGAWPLRLRPGIPSALEVLRMQAAGTRPVTVLAEFPQASRPVLGKADGFAFLVHDLEHAFKFFHDPALHAAQRRFFGLLLAAVETGLFVPYRCDPVFAGQLDYLIGDMNTHPVHGLRYLSAVLVECLLRREGKGRGEALSASAEAEMAGLLRCLGDSWGFSGPAREALMRLLAGGFDASDAEALARAMALGASGQYATGRQPAGTGGRRP